MPKDTKEKLGLNIKKFVSLEVSTKKNLQNYTKIVQHYFKRYIVTLGS